MFTLESPHRGDSNEHTQYTIININNKNTLYYHKSADVGFFSKGLKNEFETSVVNEPLKFYCIFLCILTRKKSVIAAELMPVSTSNMIHGLVFSYHLYESTLV